MTSCEKPNYLRRRAIVPAMLNLVQHGTSPAAVRSPGATPAFPLPDISNVQGDVYLVFPKRFEYFLFFKIPETTSPTQLREGLASYLPSVTSAAQTAECIKSIDAKDGKEHSFSALAFSRAGLDKLGHKNYLKDRSFDDGDTKPHGVILVTTKKQKRCEDIQEEILCKFKHSIEILKCLEGRVRKDEKDWFGFRDGISQPAVEGLTVPWPGQQVVKPGVIILGYPGDPLYRARDPRPDFTKDGCFMVFRQFEQYINRFEKHVEDRWRTIPEIPEKGVHLNDDQRKALFKARLIGRYESGVPLALCPYIEDPAYLDRTITLNFDYTERAPNRGCPLFAHIRKANPRNLNPSISQEEIKVSAIIRASIPYGEEPLPGDVNDNESDGGRGLLFVCYQSSTSNGFFKQFRDAMSDFFPPTKLVKVGQEHPILDPGLPVKNTDLNGTAVEGAAQGCVLDKISTPSKALSSPELPAEPKPKWIEIKDRGTYFVPSISTLKKWAGVA